MKYQLTELEEKWAKEFMETHNCADHRFFGTHIREAIATIKKMRGKESYHPGYSYIFTPGGGIGCGVYIRCEACGYEKDITDVSCW